MNKVTIKRTPNADTRSIEKLDRHLVYQDTLNHITAVKDILEESARILKVKGLMHDHTKTGTYFNDFFKALSSGKKDEEFYEIPWFKMHATTERHHLTAHVPEDVNLFDVIEMLADITSAGMARSGDVYEPKLDDEVLRKAFDNTLKLFKENIIVQD